MNSFLSQRRTGAVAVLAGLIRALVSQAGAGEPVAVAGTWTEPSAAGWVLQDPETRAAAATLEDPLGRLGSGGRSGVLLATFQDAPSALPAGRALDRAPEFWAQPSTWKHFQLGPAAAAGLGTGGTAGPREWAGRQAADRRGSALDPGWRTSAAGQGTGTGGGSGEPPGPARLFTLTLRPQAGGFAVGWRGLAGRRYVLESTRSLSEPFSAVGDPVTPAADTDLSRELAADGAHAFFRIVEQQPGSLP